MTFIGSEVTYMGYEVTSKSPQVTINSHKATTNSSKRPQLTFKSLLETDLRLLVIAFRLQETDMRT